MSSGLDMVSGRIRGIAATHVLNRSILGFLSPLLKMEDNIKHSSTCTNQNNTQYQRIWKWSLELCTWSCPLALCWASGHWWASYNGPLPCPSVSGCCPAISVLGSSTGTCLRRKERVCGFKNNIHNSLSWTHTDAKHTQTDKFGLLFGECLAQVSFLLFQRVSRGQSGSSVGHGRLSILLLQSICYHQECPQTYVHTLEHR